MRKSLILLASMALASPAAAVNIIQTWDPGVGEGGATPKTNSGAAGFDAINPPTFLETFEDAAATGFSITGGAITSNPAGGGSPLFGFNTTPGGDFLLELQGGSAIFSFLNPISSFGFKLTGVQTNGVSVAFNDGTAYTFGVINNGSGVQFFGVTGFTNAVTSFTVNATSDIIGIDDLRFASVSAAVPEPTTWAMILFGFGVIGGALRRRKTVASFV